MGSRVENRGDCLASDTHVQERYAEVEIQRHHRPGIVVRDPLPAHLTPRPIELDDPCAEYVVTDQPLYFGAYPLAHLLEQPPGAALWGFRVDLQRPTLPKAPRGPGVDEREAVGELRENVVASDDQAMSGRAYSPVLGVLRGKPASSRISATVSP